MTKAKTMTRPEILMQEVETCEETATIVVFRGKKQLYLCAEHVGAYTGKGMVANYRTAPVDPETREQLTRNGQRLYTGPERVCGEEAEIAPRQAKRAAG